MLYITEVPDRRERGAIQDGVVEISISEMLELAIASLWPNGSFRSVVLHLSTANPGVPVILDRVRYLLMEGGGLRIIPPQYNVVGEPGDWLKRLDSLVQWFGFRAVCPTRSLEVGERYLDYIRHEDSRWVLAPVEPQDEAGCGLLFHKVFGETIGSNLWNWKYGDGRGVGILARRGSTVVAHFGGLIRHILFRGKAALAVQICDVMVDPQERGVLSKRGAFYGVASAFREVHFGYRRDYLISYGFPNRRHMQVGERLDLYCEVERMVEIRWSQLAIKPDILTKWQRLEVVEHSARDINRLWMNMRQDFFDDILVERDWDYIKYRYLDHPCHDYWVMCVSNRILKRITGIIILRREAKECKVMDLIGPISVYGLLLKYARYQLKLWDMPALVAWIPSHKQHLLDGMAGEVKALDISIPTDSWSRKPRIEDIRGRWWLTMGDTDFL